MKLSFFSHANKGDINFSAEFLINKLDSFNKIINDDRYGFFHLTSDRSHLNETKAVYEKFKTRKYFVQIGIGGSALGPQMLIDALGKANGTKFIWLDNTDAEYLHDQLSLIDAKNALFYVVSKSGGTAETMAAMAICRRLLNEQGIADKDFNQYFVFCTDPLVSDLREIAQDQNYTCLNIPSNIGGRFSVLTAVGLLPALFAGINIEELFLGANELKVDLLKADVDHNPLLQAAAHLNYCFLNEKINQTILMPYSSKLKSFSHWFVQLWGESLGKYSKTLGINTGLTPIPAYGATDQHSQMQLFMEGPNDKFLFLLEVKNKRVDFSLDNTINKASANKLNGHTMNQLIEAQLHGTLQALQDRNRHCCLISIDHNNEKSMGALILFFESLTALMGQYFLVDPFDQPGVELGKKYAFEYLKK
jgi:glucose-6-phosphate isomerase